MRTSTKAATEAITDFTIELFNYCKGSCTGCALSVNERRTVEPALSQQEFEIAMQRVTDYGQQRGMRFRAVLTYGDVVWLPLDTLERYWEAALTRGIKLGSTMTLVDDGMDEHYERAMQLLTRMDPTAVFDITIDPVRLLRHPEYSRRVRMAAEIAPHTHLQVLLSEVVIDQFAPDELSRLIVEHTGGKPAILGFAPTLANISYRNYRYEVASAADYATRYYCATPENHELMQADLLRFHEHAKGSYADFLKQTLHIGHQLDVFPTAYTVFGDVIFDQRNHSRRIGNLRQQSLEQALSDVRLLTMSALNAAQLDADQAFGCNDCEFKPACTFNGVGMARKIYSDFENKSGSCYGPKGLVAPKARAIARRKVFSLRQDQ